MLRSSPSDHSSAPDLKTRLPLGTSMLLLAATMLLLPPQCQYLVVHGDLEDFLVVAIHH